MEYDKRIRHWYSHINASRTEYTYAYIDLSVFVHPKNPRRACKLTMEVVQVQLWNEIFYCYAIQHANELKNEIKHINAIILFYSIRHHSPQPLVVDSYLFMCMHTHIHFVIEFVSRSLFLCDAWMDILETSVYKTNRFDVDCNILWTKAYHYESYGKKKNYNNTEILSKIAKKNETKRIKWNGIQRNKRTIFALKCRG